MKIRTVLAVLLACAALPAQEVRVDPEAEQPWKKTLNYRKALKIELKELQGKKAFVVSGAAGDTAFAFITPDLPVTGKKSVSVRFEYMATAGLKNFSGGGFCNALRWYDASGKELLPMTKFKLPDANGSFQKFSGSFPVPEKAAVVNLQIGFDNPNLEPGKTFAVTDVLVSD